MGCSCSSCISYILESDKKNEINQDKIEVIINKSNNKEDLNEKKNLDDNYIIKSDNEMNNNITYKLGESTQTEDKLKKEKDYRLEKEFREIRTDKINEDDYNKLIIEYGCINDGVEVEKRPPQEYIKDKVIYYGEWDKDKNIRHGRGIQIWEDGSKYIGYWKEDKACGKGKLYHPDGDIYDGEWLNDKPNGFGTYIHKDGARYVGEWKDDKQHGNGKEIWPDGSTYEGQYREGKKSGIGKFCWLDGSTYEGNFENNNINGEGTYIFSDKRKYIGTLVNNKLEGKGVFIWPDGRKYEGEYKDDKKDGYGIFEWENGKKYKGQWKNGKQDGEGEFYFPKENIWKKGIWENGKKKEWIES